MSVRKLLITEHQQGKKPRPSKYKYIGTNGHGYHIFQEAGGKRELFTRHAHPTAGWHLRRGAWCFEFCASE